MPSALLDVALQSQMRQPGNDNIVHVPFYFSTNGSGVATLGYDYDGALTITRATNTYTLNLGGPFNSLLAANVNLAAVAASVTTVPASGTVSLVYGGAVNSTTVHGVLIVDIGQR